jgi:beta-glucanase (GH16 family)
VAANQLRGSEIQSLQAYGYGTYQVRMEVTHVPGVVASFFWIEAPNYGPHEWDIEFLTNESWINSANSGIVHLTIHPSNATVALPLPFNPSLAFHDYGFIWTSGKIVFTVDGAAAYTSTNSDLATTATGFIMANTWTGNRNWGGGPPTQQATTIYDWMQYTPEASVPIR